MHTCMYSHEQWCCLIASWSQWYPSSIFAMQGLGKTVSVIALILSDPGGPRRDWALRRAPGTALLHGDASEAEASDAAAIDWAATSCERDSGGLAPTEAVLNGGDGNMEEPHAAWLQAGEAGHSGCARLARPGSAGEVEHEPSDRVAGHPAAKTGATPGVLAAAQAGASGAAGSAEASEAGADTGAVEQALPGGTLVVVPKSILSQWAQELHQKARPHPASSQPARHAWWCPKSKV